MLQNRLWSALLSLGLGLSLLLPGADFMPETGGTGKGAGTENREWVTEEEAAETERSGFTVDETIELAVRDGTVLRGRLFLPSGQEGPFPTIVQLNGYGHGELGGEFEGTLTDLAERGFAVLHVSMRGTGTSDGSSGLYHQFGKDGYDVIEWAADQPWSNGRVGTVGLSLLGISQWLAAKELPPSLKAISPSVACADCYDALWYPGGMEAGPGRVSRSYEHELAKEHRNFDDWWQERAVSPDELKAIAESGIAALISGGWNDYISPGNVKAYEQFSAAGGTAKLIMSDGAHGYPYGVMPLAFSDYQALWFDHYLRGEDNGIEERDPVLIYVQGAEQWRYEEAWPIPDRQETELYFSAEKSGTLSSQNDGSLRTGPEQAPESSVRYSYSPQKGPFLPSLLSPDGRTEIDQSPYEAQTVTWTTGALAVPTEITGNPAVSVWASADAADADFVVLLTDVAPDGASRQVTAGYLNASRAASRSEPEPLTPGEIREYRIEFQPVSYVFKEGHRIRLSIAGGAKALPEQTSPQGPGLHPEPSAVTIHQGSGYPSSLTLPLIGQQTLETSGN